METTNVLLQSSSPGDRRREEKCVQSGIIETLAKITSCRENHAWFILRGCRYEHKVVPRFTDFVWERADGETSAGGGAGSPVRIAFVCTLDAGIRISSELAQNTLLHAERAEKMYLLCWMNLLRSGRESN